MCEAMGPTNSVVAGASGGGAAAPAVKGGGAEGLASLLPALEGVLAALRALAEKLGGGVGAAVAGATGDATGGGPAKDAKAGGSAVANAAGGPVQQSPVQVPTQVPTQVAGSKGEPTQVGGSTGGPIQGPIQGPAQLPTQIQSLVSQVDALFGKGKPFEAVLKPVTPVQSAVGGVYQFPGQYVPVKPVSTDFVGGLWGKPIKGTPLQGTPVKGTEPTQVGGSKGDGKNSPTQVGGDKGDGKDTPTQGPVQQAPVTQVGGDSGSEPVQQAPVQQTPSQSDPVQQAPVQQSPSQSDPVQSPSQSEPVKEPVQKVVSDVRVIELDHGNMIQLLADDGSYLYFNGSTMAYRARNGFSQEMQMPAGGVSLTLSDGTKFSLGMNEKDSWGELAGTPRDLEILQGDDLYAIRTDDGQSTNWENVPLTSYHLLEVATMMFDGTYSKFGSGGNVVQQTSK